MGIEWELTTPRRLVSGRYPRACQEGSACGRGGGTWWDVAGAVRVRMALALMIEVELCSYLFYVLYSLFIIIIMISRIITSACQLRVFCPALLYATRSYTTYNNAQAMRQQRCWCTNLCCLFVIIVPFPKS